MLAYLIMRNLKQDKTHTTKKISNPVRHIAETIMVKIEQTTSGILGKIFFMEELFPEYKI